MLGTIRDPCWQCPKYTCRDEPGGEQALSWRLVDLRYTCGGAPSAIPGRGQASMAWQPDSRMCPARMRRHRFRHLQVNNVALAPGGAILAAADDDGITYIWSVTTRR